MELRPTFYRSANKMKVRKIKKVHEELDQESMGAMLLYML